MKELLIHFGVILGAAGNPGGWRKAPLLAHRTDYALDPRFARMTPER